MEFRNSPPPPPISELKDESLVDDLCLGLRDVGLRDRYLPGDPDVRARVEHVIALHSEVERRGIPLQYRLAALSRETGWRMEALLQDCLLFPRVIPYLREADGVPRALRCFVCGLGEFPDREGIFVCDDCLARAIAVSKVGGPLQGFVVFRTFSPSRWCPHADEETILLCFENDDFLDPPHCTQCLDEERRRRGSVTSGC